MRVVRFYVSCLLLLLFLLFLLPRPQRAATSSVSLPDLNRDHLSPVFPAGPPLQPYALNAPRRTSVPSVPCRTSTSEHMSERMSEDMSERMTDRMSKRLSENMSERMLENMSENPPAAPACLLKRGLMMDCLSVLCFAYMAPS